MKSFNQAECEKIIGYTFKDKALLKTCFTHSSYAYEQGVESNERLEFFGDSIMEFVITEYLFTKNLGDEGKMTRIRAELVSKEPLQNMVELLGLDKFVLLGNGQTKSTNKNDKLFSSVYEALVAGIYIDGGIKQVKKFIKNTLVKEYEKSVSKGKSQSRAGYKVELQEYVQKHKLGTIAYNSLGKSGPDHKPEFTEALLINGEVIAKGTGLSKQVAQNECAKIALAKIKR